MYSEDRRSAVFVHGILPAGHHTAAAVIQSLDNKVNLTAQHISEDLVLAQYQLSVIMGFVFHQVDHHLRQGNHHTHFLIIDDSDGTAAFHPLDAAQVPGQDLPGPVGILQLMPDDILTAFLCLHFRVRAQGEDGRGGLPSGRRRGCRAVPLPGQNR